MPRDFKTILCPTDFSERSYRALEYGARFARNSDGVLILAHAIHVPAGDLVGRAPHTLNFAEAEEEALAQLREIHATRLQGLARCECVTLIGNPAEEIIGLARSRQVDLIVTTTHGRSGLLNLVMGSVAEEIIRHAPCPVFIVRNGED